ncbi:hypothetical protein [Geodermatophilus sp. SYSU D01176]
MTPASAALLSGRLSLGRFAAVAAVSTVVHILLLDPSSLGSLAMAGLAATCLPCAWRLRRGPTASVWRMTATVDAGMLVLHAQMLAGQGHEVAGLTHFTGSSSAV